MYSSSLVFTQVMEHLPMHVFRRCVLRYRGNHKIKSFSCLDQFRCMAFAQLTYRESLRDIESLFAFVSRQALPHAGIPRKNISEYTLADANESSKTGKYIPTLLMFFNSNSAQTLYVNKTILASTLESTPSYAFDATTVRSYAYPCFPWAHFGHQLAGGIKLHTLLDLPRQLFRAFISHI